MNFDMRLSSDDVQAIVCALPLVVEFRADTPHQQELNARFCMSAVQKLMSGASTFEANEIRVISAAISGAVLLLSGGHSDLFPSVSKELKSDLSKHFFTLNKLNPYFQEMFDRIESSQKRHR